MNKIFTLIFLFLLFSNISRAQYVVVQSTAFRNFLMNRYPGCFNAAQEMDTTCTAITTEDSLVFHNLTGSITIGEVRYFDALVYLDASENNISFQSSFPVFERTLPVTLRYINFSLTWPGPGTGSSMWLPFILPPLLEHFDFSGHNTEINFEYPSNLVYLNISYNSIQGFPHGLPASLDTLICNYQYDYGFVHPCLTSLQGLPAGLRYLNCRQNGISSISSLPPALKWLDCSSQYTHLISYGVDIPVLQTITNLPPALEYLNCPYNILSGLPDLPASLRYLNCAVNKVDIDWLGYSLHTPGIDALPALPASLIHLNAGTNNLSEIPVLPPSLAFLACDGNALLNCLPQLPVSMGGTSPYNTGSNNLNTSGTNITCIPNSVAGMLPQTALPVCSTGNPNGCSFGSLPVIGAASNISGLVTVPGVASGSASFNLYGYNLNPVSGNITVTASTLVEISTDNINFSSLPITVAYVGGQLSPTPIFVRLTSTAGLGPVSATVTNSGSGANDAVINVNGNVIDPYIAAGPAVYGLNTAAGLPSASGFYSLSAMGLVPAAGNITVTASSGSLEVSTDNINFSTSILVPYTDGQLATTTIYVRISAAAPSGTISGSIQNSGGGVTDVVVNVQGVVYVPNLFFTSSNPINGLSTALAVPSAGATYLLDGNNLYPANGSVTVTASANLEVSTDNINFSSTANYNYTIGGMFGQVFYVRISSIAPAGPISGTVTHSGGGAPDAILIVNGYVYASTITAGPDVNNLITLIAPISGNPGTPWVTGFYNLSANDLNPATGNITVTPGSFVEISIDNINYFSSPLSVAYSSGSLTVTPIYVRISPAILSLGAFTGTITNSGGGAADVIVNVTGTAASDPPGQILTASPDISGLTAVLGTASAALPYNLSGFALEPISGSITVTPGSFLEVSTDNINFSATPLLVPYIGGQLPVTIIYVRISSTAPAGPVTGTVTNINSNGTGSQQVINVNGNVTVTAPIPQLGVGPDQLYLATTAGIASIAEVYEVSAFNLTPQVGYLQIIASPNLEISEDNLNFSSSITTVYQSNAFGEYIYVRISSTAPVGTISGTITNTAIGAGVPDAIVNVNVDVSPPVPPVITAGPDINGLSTVSGTASASSTYHLSGNYLIPASGNITVTPTGFLEVSTNNINFTSMLSVPYSANQLAATTIYVRIAAGAPTGIITGTITNSGAGATDAIVSVSGNVSTPPIPVIIAGPDISGLSASGGNASVAQPYTLSASNLVPAIGNITITPSSTLEVSTDNINFTSSLSVPYSGSQLAGTTIYVRIVAGTPTGAISGTVTNSGGGAADAIVQVSGTSARPAPTSITIGPNPARDVVTVYLPGNASTVSIDITNERGQSVRRVSTNKESVQVILSDLSRGIYTVKIKGGDINEVRRLLVN